MTAPLYTAQNPGPWKHTLTGRKWSAHCSTRYFSGGFDFHTFPEAIAYLHQMQAMSKLQDLQGLAPFRCEITGPGGKLSHHDLLPLL